MHLVQLCFNVLNRGFNFCLGLKALRRVHRIVSVDMFTPELGFFKVYLLPWRIAEEHVKT